MALIIKRPLTPGQRFRIALDYSPLTKGGPEPSLLQPLPKKAGRDARGRISSRSRGGGNRHHYRVIDFKRNKDGIPAQITSIEYDPNRNAFIALLQYRDGEKRYILAPEGVKVGEEIQSGEGAEIRPGNALPLRLIPIGTFIHNIELSAGRGGVLVRGAGAQAQLVAKEGDYATIRLPSSEQRMIRVECRATIGQVSNLDAKSVRLGKAGRMRYLGRRPQVRGTAMNPCDHPHGGGEGRSGIGRKHPLTPWGKPTLGFKTRRRRHRYEPFILVRRGG